MGSLASKVRSKLLSKRRNRPLLAAVERPTLFAGSSQQSRRCQQGKMPRGCRGCDPELVPKVIRTDAILLQIAIYLRRKMPRRRLEPLQDLQPHGTRQSFEDE